MTNLLQSLSISASGLSAQAERINIVSQNIANVDTPGYRRKLIHFSEILSDSKVGHISAEKISLDDSELERKYAPSHPLSDQSGYYNASNVSLMVELADSKDAQRSYQANLQSFENARQMSRALLEVLRK